MWPTHEILAQKPSFEWENLLYILIFLILPALKGFGDWIRKKVGTEETTEDDGDTVYEVAVGENDELVLKPASTPQRPTHPVRTPARSHPASPVPHAPPPSPPPTPIAKPAPQRRPAARPAPKAPQPARAHPARAVRRQPAQLAKPAQSARAAHGRVAKAIESHSLLNEEAVDAILLEEQDSLQDHHAAHDLIADETFDAKSLKKAFILSEILAPPLAIRPTGNSLFSQLE